MHPIQQILGKGRADDLTHAAGGGRQAEGKRPLFRRSSSANNPQNHTKACASDTKTDKHFQPLMLNRADRIGAEAQAGGI